MVIPEGAAVAPAKKRKRVSRKQLCREIWAEVEQAAKAAAMRRGWAYETTDDLYAAMRRLDEENPEPRRSFVSSFGGSQLFRDNLEYDCMDLAEIRFFQPVAEQLVQRLESL